MKIIGHTAYGYLAELAPSEIAAITGEADNANHQSMGNRYGARNHSIGTEFKVHETWKHLVGLLANETHRKAIAESLRAAATLIDHTPSPLTPPTPPAPVE